MSRPPLRIYLARHLRPLVPKGYAYGSDENVPLNTEGPHTLSALDAIARALPDAFFAASSPSPRAQTTTREVLRRKNRPVEEYITDARFHEQNWGAWQGKFYDEIPADELAYYNANEDERAPPDGENLNQLKLRVGEGLDDYAAQYASGKIVEPAVFIGAHGGVIRAAFAHAEGHCVSAYLKQRVRRLSLNVLEYTPETDAWSVAERNMTIHPVT